MVVEKQIASKTKPPAKSSLFLHDELLSYDELYQPSTQRAKTYSRAGELLDSRLADIQRDLWKLKRDQVQATDDRTWNRLQRQIERLEAQYVEVEHKLKSDPWNDYLCDE